MRVEYVRRLGKALVLAAIFTMSLMISLAKPAKCQPVFTPSSQSHIQNLTWGYGGILWGQPRYSYVGGFAYTADLNPSYFQVQKTRTTVSFPNTPNPSVLGAGNWLAAGMFARGQGGEDREDYGFYAVLILDCNGGLWYDVGAWHTKERVFPWESGPACDLDFHKTWLIQGVDRSTPVTLTMYWDPGPTKTVFWCATVNGQDYYPEGNSFNMGSLHNIIKAFYVGMVELLADVYPWSWWCYYFQFGIMSPVKITQGGWKAMVCNPQYFKDGNWQNVAKACSIQGQGAFIDYNCMWGGTTYTGINVYSGQSPGMYTYATFYYDGSTLIEWLLLWPLEGGGGCPFVSSWDGTRYVVDNNILPASETNGQADVEDYYKLEQSLVPRFKTDLWSVYSLRIQEFENEHDYIDQLKLVAVDHSQGTSVAVTPEGEILTYMNPAVPISCVDNNGINRLSEINDLDGNVSEPATYFQGYEGDYLIIDFGHVTASNAKLVLRDDQKCADLCIEVQTPNGYGNWQTVEVLCPRDFWAMDIVNLTAFIPQSGNLTVRLLWTAPHRLDYVGLDVTAQADFETHTAFMLQARYDEGGDARRQLAKNDGIYAELIPNKYIELEFALPTDSREMRTFIFFAEGHYRTMP